MIVGHSERRQLFGEDDERREQEGPRRVRARDDADPVRGRDARGARGRRHGTKVAGQVRARVRWASTPSRRRRPSIAYEPIWAIGTGRNAEPADAGGVIEGIRETLGRLYADGVARPSASSTAAA